MHPLDTNGTRHETELPDLAGQKSEAQIMVAVEDLFGGLDLAAQQRVAAWIAARWGAPQQGLAQPTSASRQRPVPPAAPPEGDWIDKALFGGGRIPSPDGAVFPASKLQPEDGKLPYEEESKAAPHRAGVFSGNVQEWPAAADYASYLDEKPAAMNALPVVDSTLAPNGLPTTQDGRTLDDAMDALDAASAILAQLRQGEDVTDDDLRAAVRGGMAPMDLVDIAVWGERFQVARYGVVTNAWDPSLVHWLSYAASEYTERLRFEGHEATEAEALDRAAQELRRQLGEKEALSLLGPPPELLAAWLDRIVKVFESSIRRDLIVQTWEHVRARCLGIEPPSTPLPKERSEPSLADAIVRLGLAEAAAGIGDEHPDWSVGDDFDAQKRRGG